MKPYLVAYRPQRSKPLVCFYTFRADDAEHAIEQFRNAEPDRAVVVVSVVRL